MSKNIIKINRGDSFSFSVRVTNNIDNSTYQLTTSDAVYFGLLYPHQPLDDNALLVKGFDLSDQNVETGDITIKIEPNDTRGLESGVYYYTVKLQRGGTLETLNDYDDAIEVSTLIERTKFIIND